MKSVGQPLPESGEGEEGGPPAPKKAKASSGPAFPQQMCEPCGVNLTSQIQADQHYQVGFWLPISLFPIQAKYYYA